MSLSDTPATPAASRVRRVRHEIVRRDLTVARVEAITPNFRRIVLAGPQLDGFISASFDDHLKFIVDPGGPGQAMRDYTPRHYDAARRELTLEFALHGDGPAAEWAAQAAPGQRATIAGPRGSMIVPTDYAWHLLVGDETALPAIARRLEELPAGARAIVIGQVAAADRRRFATQAELTLQWVDTPAELVAAVRALALPNDAAEGATDDAVEGEGYAWCAGEARTMAELRRVLVDEKGHSRHAIRAAAYWKQGAAGHHENIGD